MDHTLEVGEFLGLTASKKIQDSGVSNKDHLLEVKEYKDTPEKIMKITSKLTTSTDLSFLPQEHLVVADTEQGVLKIFDNDGRYLNSVLKNVRPFGVATYRSGTIAFTDAKRKEDKFVRICSDEGHRIASWGEDLDWKPRGIAISNRGQVIVTDIYKSKHNLGIYTLDGKNVSKFGTSGDGKADFDTPLHVFVDAFDRILVTDKNNHRIKFYDERSGLIGTMGQKGSRKGDFLFPRGICADGVGNIFVADTANRRVSLFSKDGQFIKHILTRHNDHIGFPIALDLLRDGRMAVSQHNAAENGAFRKIRMYNTLEQS